jgi:hypothetical protein
VSVMRRLAVGSGIWEWQRAGHLEHGRDVAATAELGGGGGGGSGGGGSN